MTPELQELYDIISGRGKYSILGSGLHTYPTRNDNDSKIFSSCLELEKLGYIIREIDTKDYVLWGLPTL